MQGQWKFKFVSLPTVIVFLLCVSESHQRLTPQEVKVLSDKLLVNYSKYMFPSLTEEPYDVSIGVQLQALGNINEIDEIFSAVFWFHYLWKDDLITWNQEQRNITYITLGWNDVWKPMLRLTNPQTDSVNSPYCDRSYDSVIYRYDGMAYYDEVMTTRTSCDLDMSYYPFDVQTCDVAMILVGSTKFLFNLNVKVYKGFTEEDAEHGAWTLKYLNASSHKGTLTVTLKFERRPLFILLNIILPLMILALLTPIVFILPNKSGERVGYAVAMLLAISVYMVIVSDHLPHNSKPAPLMPIMVFTWYVFDACVVLVVVINTNIHLTKADKPIPNVFRKFVLLTRKLSCKRNQPVSDNVFSEDNQKCIEMETDNVKEDEEKRIPEDTPETDKEKETADSRNETDVTNEVTWKELSNALDKWFFVLSYILKLTLPIAFLATMSGKGHA